MCWLWILSWFDTHFSHVAQLVKNPPAMWETWIRSLGWEDPWRRERLPTPVFWPGEFCGLYSPWGHKEVDTTERLSLFTSPIYRHTDRQAHASSWLSPMPPTDFVLMPYSLWLNVIYWVCLFSATAKCRNIKDLIICDYKDSLINCCNWGIDQNQNSVQFSCSVVSNSLRPHGLQHATPPCPSPTPRVHSDSCPLTRWCHPTISSSMVPFSPRLQSFPASGSFQMSQFFASGCQSIGVSASASVLPKPKF